MGKECEGPALTSVGERQDSCREAAEMRVMKHTASKETEGLQAGNRARDSQEEISKAACKNEKISMYRKRHRC